jgi:hypothetical protein
MNVQQRTVYGRQCSRHTPATRWEKSSHQLLLSHGITTHADQHPRTRPGHPSSHLTRTATPSCPRPSHINRTTTQHKSPHSAQLGPQVEELTARHRSEGAMCDIGRMCMGNPAGCCHNHQVLQSSTKIPRKPPEAVPCWEGPRSPSYSTHTDTDRGMCKGLDNGYSRLQSPSPTPSLLTAHLHAWHTEIAQLAQSRCSRILVAGTAASVPHTLLYCAHAR